MSGHLCDGDTFDHRGYTFRVRFEHDDQHGEPWKESDGHGIVSEWTSRDKRPGERVIATDRRSKRFYDVVGTLAIARRDGWGTSDGRQPGESARAYAARAVDEDFEYLRLWCADQWEYVGVIVCAVNDDDDETDGDPSTALWGVETYRDYHVTVARELADELMAQIEVDEPDAIVSEN